MPRSQHMTTGRTIVAAFDHGEDFHTALDQVCAEHSIRQGYIPTFIAGFATVDLVGTCQHLNDPDAPVWSAVQLSNVEAIGGGTLAWNEADQRVAPHLHVAVGLKQHSATAHASHLLKARVQFLTELTIVELTGPSMIRRAEPGLYDVPLLRFQIPEPSSR
jgi:predicted DNA-binding protein with PD1-like motif